MSEYITDETLKKLILRTYKRLRVLDRYFRCKKVPLSIKKKIAEAIFDIDLYKSSFRKD